MTAERVAKLSDLNRDSGFCAKIGEIEIALFVVDGEVHAMENACPHAGEPLCNGAVRSGVVTCPAHGWKFDVRTGFKPEDADGWPIPCFRVIVDGDDVWVDLEDPVNLRRRAR